MTGLFARLYFDEDVSARVPDMLRARGFDIMTTLDANRLGAADRSQLEFSVSEGRTRVTHNRCDFKLLANEWFENGRPHAGIIIAVRRQPRGLGQKLLEVLNRHTADELRNQILYV